MYKYSAAIYDGASYLGCGEGDTRHQAIQDWASRQGLTVRVQFVRRTETTRVYDVVGPSDIQIAKGPPRQIEGRLFCLPVAAVVAKREV